MRFSDLKRTAKAALLLLLCVCLLPASLPAAAYSEQTTNIRIGLYYASSRKSACTLTSPSGFYTLDCDAELDLYSPSAVIADTQVTVKASGSTATVQNAAGETLASAEGVLYLTCGDGGSGIGLDGKTYIQVLQFTAADSLLQVVNILSLDNYIKGVLPKEIYPSWHPEALKAAAVTARSYTLASIGGKHAAYGFDLCNTTCCQVFGGNGKNEYPSTNAAVDETAGLVMMYNGKPALAVYCVASGDATESVGGAWGGDGSGYPYLRSVPTPFETPTAYPGCVWTRTVDAQELLRYIAAQPAHAGKLSGALVSFTPTYGESGYVRKLTVTDTTGKTLTVNTSANVRSLLMKYVKSAKFTITPLYGDEPKTTTVTVLTADGTKTAEVSGSVQVLTAESELPRSVLGTRDHTGRTPTAFCISGVGHGHGVGLSQYGANQMARDGSNYREILTHYYTGVRIGGYNP